MEQVLYANPFTRIVLSDKSKSVFISEKNPRPNIISYLLFPCNSSTWKSRVVTFVASNSGITIYVLILWFFLKSPRWVIQWTGVVVLLHNYYVSAPNIIEDIAPESSRILSD